MRPSANPSVTALIAERTARYIAMRLIEDRNCPALIEAALNFSPSFVRGENTAFITGTAAATEADDSFPNASPIISSDFMTGEAVACATSTTRFSADTTPLLNRSIISRLSCEASPTAFIFSSAFSSVVSAVCFVFLFARLDTPELIVSICDCRSVKLLVRPCISSLLAPKLILTFSGRDSSASCIRVNPLKSTSFRISAALAIRAIPCEKSLPSWTSFRRSRASCHCVVAETRLKNPSPTSMLFSRSTDCATLSTPVWNALVSPKSFSLCRALFRLSRFVSNVLLTFSDLMFSVI